MARAQRSRLISCRRVWAEYGEETAPNGCGVAADTGRPTEFGLAKGVESDVRAPWLSYGRTRGADLRRFAFGAGRGDPAATATGAGRCGGFGMRKAEEE